MENEEKKQPGAIDLEPEVVFRYLSDKRIFGVKSDEDGETIFEISGYDLQVRFNRDKLQSVEEIEGTLDGIKDLFRKLIMADLLDKKDTVEKNAT